jgi:hypothetical protein
MILNHYLLPIFLNGSKLDFWFFGTRCFGTKFKMVPNWIFGIKVFGAKCNGIKYNGTLQDITTVDNDLKSPLAHFEDFLDHVTDHMNNYESLRLRSFNQPVSNTTKIQTFKESIKWQPQFDTLIATWEIDNNNVLVRDFAKFTDYLVKPRGRNAYNAR